jgi:DNA-binding CsgD family transcriptional regulator
VDQDRRLREFRLAGAEPVRIGRNPGCEVCLDDISVSRHHVLISLIGDTWFAENVSAHGTVVETDHRPIRLTGRYALSSGDRLRLGRTVVTFRDEDEAPVHVTVPLRERSLATALTLKEREVLIALCTPVARRTGPPLSNDELAAGLNLSIDGVRSHLRSIYSKLGLTEGTAAQRRTALVQLAIDEGYVPRG